MKQDKTLNLKQKISGPGRLSKLFTPNQNAKTNFARHSANIMMAGTEPVLDIEQLFKKEWPSSKNLAVVVSLMDVSNLFAAE